MTCKVAKLGSSSKMGITRSRVPVRSKSNASAKSKFMNFKRLDLPANLNRCEAGNLGGVVMWLN